MPVPATYALRSANLDVGNGSSSDIFRAPTLGDREPLLPKAGLDDDDSIENLDFEHILKEATANTRLGVSKAGRNAGVLKRAASEQNHNRYGRHSDSAIVPDRTTAAASQQGRREEVSKRKSSSHSRTLHQSQQSVLRHASSNSVLETRLQRQDRVADFRALHQRLVQSQKPPLRPGQIKRVQPASDGWRSSGSLSLGIQGFRWISTRSTSDPSSVPQIKSRGSKRGKDLPLKPCMKQKSKSATTTPPTGQSTTPVDSRDEQSRAKTVEFEETFSKKLFPLPLLQLWAGKPSPPAPSQPLHLQRRSSCPGPEVKGRPAEAAITRTDVHVVAITPSSSFAKAASKGTVQEPTPTMQIVESKAGRYEVIWDNVSYDCDIRTRRRTSSASQSLHAATSAATKGLDRVSTKLAEWTGDEDAPPGPFRAQVVVFPDQDSRAPRKKGSEDDDGLKIYAPPTSVRTSGGASRNPSSPESAGISRPSSSDEVEKVDLATKSPFTDDYDIRGRQAVQSPSADRRLSNMVDSEIKFRRHRDSVALARSRVFNAGGGSSDAFPHRDSVSLAKKRIKSKRSSNSAPRRVPRLETVASESSLGNRSDPDPDASPPPSETTQSTPPLPLYTSTQGHIRFVE